MVSLCYGVYLMLPTFILHVKPRGKSGSGVCMCEIERIAENYMN